MLLSFNIHLPTNVYAKSKKVSFPKVEKIHQQLMDETFCNLS